MSNSNAVANGVAGAGGGIIAQIITYPLQTVNTRQQTERRAKRILTSASTSPTPTPTALVQILQVIKNEGWGGLYSGLKPSLFGTAASQGIYYYFYQVFKNKAESIANSRKNKGRGDGSVGMFSWLIVAALAGCTTHTQAERKIREERKESMAREVANSDQSSITLLHDNMAKLDSLKPTPYGTIHAAQEVYREAGIRGFWRGIIPTLIMVCNPSIQFMIYETSLNRLKARRNKASKPGSNTSATAFETFLLGALAKLGATVSTYPLLVVKSRLQAKQEIGGNSSLRYSGTIDAIMKMIRYEGLSSFYKGMSTKIVQSVFAASLLFMIKEELVKAYVLMAHKSHLFLSNLRKIR
ncbi:hypothetical protein F8388_012561 [Cannabis sativa]|uniref:Peroxisomal nicotinamide adenine dinucleotide carrier n=1 Tax=Cannabis sativa TaxID=3483 RepID=A0A7J6DTG1_CANSA|nr:hypothetical protein F8388_012561 [Cannabis sativa]